MNKSSLGVHEVKLVVQPGPGLHDGGGVGEAADGPHHFGQVSSRHNSGRLVVDPDLNRFVVFNKAKTCSSYDDRQTIHGDADK